jgi:uncharacterized protein YuzE
VDTATIARVTFDDSANAGYIYVQPSRELNVVETNIVGVQHGETLEVETRYWTNIDTDNFGRLAGIEILAPGDLKAGKAAKGSRKGNWGRILNRACSQIGGRYVFDGCAP